MYDFMMGTFSGMLLRAQTILQGVLSESPSHAEAMSHLGVNFYQQGERSEGPMGSR